MIIDDYEAIAKAVERLEAERRLLEDQQNAHEPTPRDDEDYCIGDDFGYW